MADINAVTEVSEGPLNVNINSRTASELRRIAKGAEISYTETLRRAVGVLSYLSDQQDDGKIIQSQNLRTGKIKQLVIL